MTALALGDIQGMILGGFNTDFEVACALTLDNVAGFPGVLAWLATLSDAVTSVSDLKATRVEMKEAAATAPDYWLGVAVGKRTLDALGDFTIRDAAFNLGMIARARSVLGDFTDAAAWKLGAARDPVDVLLVIGSNVRANVETGMDALVVGASAAGLRVAHRILGARLPGEREHFGFRDGISQPKVIGFDPDGTLGAGNFVFGYPASGGGTPVLPVLDRRGLAPNGSLLVIRRLVQDVRAFENFCATEAQRVSGEWPGLTGPHLAALLVGRWPSGAPVRKGVSQDPGGDPPADGFDFRDDDDGRHCPLAAHIRKVNPRSGARDEVNVPRILRRGIPFGLPADDDKGLLFVSFQTVIPDQFEKLTHKWMNGAISPNRGNDLLVGRSLTTRTMKILGPHGEISISDGSRQWITPTGGAYLFAPGKIALSRFGETVSPSPFWRVRSLLVRSLDRAVTLRSG